MRILVALSLVVYAASVHANNNSTPVPPTPHSDSTSQAVGIGVGVGVGGKAVATSEGGSAASDAQASADATGGAATATQTQDSSQSLTVNHKAVRNAPSIALGSVFPTADCQGGFGIGGSGVNGSGLLNFSFSKSECQIVVLAQNFAALGMPDVSCEILKTTKAWQKAVKRNPNLAAVCETPEVVRASDTYEPASFETPPDMSQYATKDYVDRAFRQSVSK